MLLTRRGWPIAFAIGFVALSMPSANAADWIHWRGPEQNGVSNEKGLPDTFDLSVVGKGNLLWKQPIGGRSAPLVMGGKVYTISGYDAGKLTEGERIVCMDAETGKIDWETKFGVFLTDIVSSRLGWTSLAADPAKGTIYAHTTAGHLLALSAKDGKIIWKRQLTEEFGRVTGYGGRISSPIFDSGLVIVGFVNGSWGDQARGHNRFVAFDGGTGEIVWWSSPTESLNQPNITLKGTYYSNPVIAVINGQRLLISGGADGCIHALKVRTGERVWSHHFCAGVVNPSPVVDGNFVYVCHGEENPEGGSIGRVVCLDASKIKNGKPEVVWDVKNLARRFGLASPALHDGKLFVPEDGGELFTFDAKTGKLIWKYKFGTVARGAPLIADGKLYIFDVFGKLSVISKLGDKEPDRDEDVQEHRFRPRAGGILETNGTPIAVNGRIYFQTLDDTYAVGNAKVDAAAPAYKPLAEETLFDPKAAPASIRLFPADLTATPGVDVKLAVRYLDANGRRLEEPADAKVEWSFPNPPLPPTAPKGANPPPALKASAKGEGVYAVITLDKGPPPAQQGYVVAKVGDLTARARIRVAPTLPFKPNFTNVPVGASPGGWINTQGKYAVVEIMEAGKPVKVLSKVNTDARPPIARANAYLTTPDATNYTVQSDMKGGVVDGKFPDMGVIANRYLLVLDGKLDPNLEKRTLRIVSWEARNRINKVIAYDWKPDTWYRVKFKVEQEKGKAVIRGKVWDRSLPEPADWTIEFTDPNPNTEGAAALYGYVANVTQVDGKVVPGSPIHYDNVSVVPNGKK